MTIEIEDLSFTAIIGLLDFERENSQEVKVNLEASYEYSEGNFVNYAHIAQEIEDEIKSKKYLLLEDALLGLESRLSASFPLLKTLYIKISKPNILPNCTVSLSKKWVF